MAAIARIRWTAPGPRRVDEELLLYADGTAWLVVRSSRDGSPSVGTWSTTASSSQIASLRGTERTVDERTGVLADAALRAAADLSTAARANPVATLTFYASASPGARGSGQGVALLAVGGGIGAAHVELDPDGVVVHVQDEGGVEVTWRPAARLAAGFVSPEPVGLGGVGRPAQIQPGSYGAIALELPAGPLPGSAVAVSVTGTLVDATPEAGVGGPFSVRTAAVEVAG